MRKSYDLATLYIWCEGPDKETGCIPYFFSFVNFNNESDCVEGVLTGFEDHDEMAQGYMGKGWMLVQRDKKLAGDTFKSVEYIFQRESE